MPRLKPKKDVPEEELKGVAKQRRIKLRKKEVEDIKKTITETPTPGVYKVARGDAPRRTAYSGQMPKRYPHQTDSQYSSQLASWQKGERVAKKKFIHGKAIAETIQQGKSLTREEVMAIAEGVSSANSATLSQTEITQAVNTAMSLVEKVSRNESFVSGVGQKLLEKEALEQHKLSVAQARYRSGKKKKTKVDYKSRGEEGFAEQQASMRISASKDGRFVGGTKGLELAQKQTQEMIKQRQIKDIFKDPSVEQVKVLGDELQILYKPEQEESPKEVYDLSGYTFKSFDEDKDFISPILGESPKETPYTKFKLQLRKIEVLESEWAKSEARKKEMFETSIYKKPSKLGEKIYGDRTVTKVWGGEKVDEWQKPTIPQKFTVEVAELMSYPFTSLPKQIQIAHEKIKAVTYAKEAGYVQTVREESLESLKKTPSAIDESIQYILEDPLRLTAFGTITLGFLKTPKTIKDIPGKIMERVPGTKKAKQFNPSQEIIKEVSKRSNQRQRATILLKDEKGKYILGKTRSGEVISVGGGIKKNQSPKAGALMELKEETGLTAKDVNLKYKGKVVYPDETHYVYIAELSKQAKSKMKPKSDISGGFVEVSKREAMGITGQTSVYPMTKSGIRTYELGLINFVETGKQPTWLYIETKFGTTILAPQSRYDVSPTKMFEYMKQDSLKLAHGTPQRVINLINKELKVDPTKSVRFGSDPGIFWQPPLSSKKFPGMFEEKFLRRGKEIYLKKRVPKFELKSPQSWSFKIKGKKPGTFYQFEKPQQISYVGLTYLELIEKGLSYEKLGLKIGWKRPTVLFTETKPTHPFKLTSKAKRGGEVEIIQTTGTLRKAGSPTKVWIGGKRVSFQSVDLIKDIKIFEKIKEFSDKTIPKSQRRKIARQLKRETGIEYGQYEYISPIEFFKPITYTPKPTTYNLKSTTYTPKSTTYTPKSTTYTPKPTTYTPKPTTYTPKPTTYTPKPTTYTPKPTTYTPPPFSTKTKTQGYNTYAKEITRDEKGNIKEQSFIRINKKPLAKTDALSLGLRAVDQSAARTFHVKQTSQSAEKPATDFYWNANRGKVRPKISKGKAVSRNMYIEKSKFAIDTPGEIEGITVKGWQERQRRTRKNIAGVSHHTSRGNRIAPIPIQINGYKKQGRGII